MLAPRRRKAVNYNEAKLHKKYVTDSESEATAVAAASEDSDDSNAEEGAQAKVMSLWLHAVCLQGVCDSCCNAHSCQHQNL